jgi:Fe-S-cluster-containing dehydrogenase component
MKEKFQQKELPISDNLSYDSKKCTGCKLCELVCSYYHNGLFKTSISRIHIFNDVFSGFNKADICRQCIEPQCYHKCPINAIYIDENTGARIIDGEKCDGCGVCANSCIFNEEKHVIKYDQDKKVFIKCDLCNGNPKCVEWCVTKALTFVKRSE